MHKGILLFILSINLFAWAQTPELDIRKVLDKQVVDWNRGDVDAFMQGYEASAQTTFVGKSVTRGHSGVLADYKKRYPTKENMGALRFEIQDVRMLGQDHASVLGKFFLKRSQAGGGDKDGIFTLVLKKTANGWKIILDHTS